MDLWLLFFLGLGRGGMREKVLLSKIPPRWDDFLPNVVEDYVPCLAGDGADVANLPAQADPGFVVRVAEVDEVLDDALAGCREGQTTAPAGLVAVLLAIAGGGY